MLVHQAPRASFLCLAAVLGMALVDRAALKADEIDLRNALVVSPANASKSEQKAIQLLVEEVQKRTLIRWQVADKRTDNQVPAIVVDRAPAGQPAEGFQILVAQ